MNNKLNGKKNESREKLVIPVIILIAAMLLLYFRVLEPAVSNYNSLCFEEKDFGGKLETIKKQLSPGVTAKKGNEKNIIFLLNYLEGLTGKSNIKLKSFSEVGQAIKGVSSFQMRFSGNADTALKFLYISEKTDPSLIVNNFRLSSVAGGSYSSMRQLEGLATITLITRGAEKVKFSGLEKFKSIWRDPFAEVKAPEPKKVEVVEEEEEEEEVEVIKWTLTAQMRDDDGDYLILTNSESKNTKVINFKGKEGISIIMGDDKAEITVNSEKIEWKLGESKEEEKLPAKLKEIFNEGGTPGKDTGKSKSSDDEEEE